ncbi:MAG TPA: hypothetical protein [Caudoviricetes sp.]|nr:MAG TPA: hypothetical protein [Caudoviricetes sp.]
MLPRVRPMLVSNRLERQKPMFSSLILKVLYMMLAAE